MADAPDGVNSWKDNTTVLMLDSDEGAGYLENMNGRNQIRA